MASRLTRCTVARRFMSGQGQAKQASTNSPAAQRCIDLETKFGAKNYAPLPVVLTEGKGIFVTDVDGKKYMDFLSAYSAVNQGHSHPKIVETMTKQAATLSLTSRAFHNDALGEYSEFVTKFFDFDRVLPMNTGVEACETAVKLARRWGYQVKGIPQDQARVVFANNNFWGRTIAAVSSSTDPDSYNLHGPFVPGFYCVEYDNIQAMKAELEAHGKNTCAVMLEPIQGEAGVVVPSQEYLSEVRKLCDQHNVLLIIDEIQTGLGRTGKWMCHEHFNVKPDICTLGKALSGGMFPVSAVLSSNEVMDTLVPGCHGSTYGGNPLACKIAKTALEVLRDEDMVSNSHAMGERFRAGLAKIKTSKVKLVRGKGLLNAMVINEVPGEPTAWDVCLALRDGGLLAKPTHGDIIRFAPPLCITAEQIDEGVSIIEHALENAVCSGEAH